MVFANYISILMALLSKSTRDPLVRDEALKRYDFVVVGAGASGSAVASRLAEVPGIRVLLLEAGPTDYANPAVSFPFAAETLLRSELDWFYGIVPQKKAKGITGGVGAWSKGKILGGSTSLNAMMYIRGSQHDYDSWQDHGARGWNWEGVEPYFKKVECAKGEGLSSNLGREGMVNITKAYTSPLTENLLKAGEEIGIKMVDYHDELEGMSTISSSMDSGMRQSASTSYLRKYEKRWGTLHVLTEAHVTKVNLKKCGKSCVKAIGVHYLHRGQTKFVKAMKEVIISAGSIASPQILMLSGIGPKEHLEELEIKTIVDSPGVGSNLQDHLTSTMYFRDDLDDYHDNLFSMTQESVDQFLQNDTGKLVNAFGLEAAYHFRTKYFDTPISLSTKKRPFPSIQTLFCPKPHPLVFPIDVTTYSVAILGLQHPKSRGTIRLKSNDPLDYPIIDPKYLDDEGDMLLMISAFQQMEKLELSEARKSVGYKLLVPRLICNGSANVDVPRSAEFYRCYIQQITKTLWHPCCTAKMGRKTDPMSVVDERLRVRGVRGLRVADASVMPHETSSNIQAPCMMIGEKVADMIKQDWNLHNKA